MRLASPSTHVVTPTLPRDEGRRRSEAMTLEVNNEGSAGELSTVRFRQESRLVMHNSKRRRNVYFRSVRVDRVRKRNSSRALRSPMVCMTLIATLISLGVAPAAQAAEPTRVCAPNGRCVTTTEVCRPGESCSRELFREVPTREYCAASVGCSPWQGRNYRYVGGDAATHAQREAAMKCAASLGVT